MNSANRLEVLSLAGRDSCRRQLVLCKCLCGNNVIHRKLRVDSGEARSCGKCHLKEKFPREYSSYCSMIKRCYDPRSNRFHRYGARGIVVCQSWKQDFFNFLNDIGLRPEGKSLNRKNNDGNYEKDNCNWATPTEQAQNRSKQELD